MGITRNVDITDGFDILEIDPFVGIYDGVSNESYFIDITATVPNVPPYTVTI